MGTGSIVRQGAPGPEVTAGLGARRRRRRMTGRRWQDPARAVRGVSAPAAGGGGSGVIWVMSQGLCDVVVGDGGLAVDEVLVVLGVEDGDVDVVAGEALDSGAR